MGRMTWFKMFVNFDDPERWTSKADNEELGAWVRLLRLASISPVKGKIEIADGIPYTPEQLKKVIKSEKDYLKKWEIQGAIKQENGVIIIEKWGSYQSEYERQKPYRQELLPKVTNESYSESDPVEERRKNKEERSKKKEEIKNKDIPPADAVGKINCVKIWIDEWNARIGTRQVVIVDGKETTKKYIPTDRERGNLKNVADRCENEADYRARVIAFLTSENFANDYTIPVFLGTLNSTKKMPKTEQIKYGKDY